ncbi:MAG: hypothetical protein HY741_12980 [Chloroflexi bacterium]|nr:hypothetical protein [Chloroflexota bacterium]
MVRIFSLLLAGALALLYIWKVRPWMRVWGTQGDEATRPLPGDEAVPEAMASYTRAITINAPPETVFPWLVQMGLNRGGFYSYDALDNEGKPSATSIVPELQALKVGDRIMLDRKTAMTVTHLNPPRAMVWAMPDTPVELGLTASMSMAFVLQPRDTDRSRLLARIRGRLRGLLSQPYFYLLFEWVDFVMHRKQLLGIKERAEAQHRSSEVSNERASRAQT